MKALPEKFRRFDVEAKVLLNQNLVGEVIFSGETYQVQVADPLSGEEYWSFLQFDKKHRLKDYFCSCEGEGEAEECGHLAASYLRIFESGDLPLHVRFEESLWNRICRHFAFEYGDEAEILDRQSGMYLLKSAGETVFSAEPRSSQGRRQLEKIIDERVPETEETSLKFSNLSEEEIRLWKQGRPSSQLRYELSFWNDLAKWLMFLQDRRDPYTIKYSFASQEIPERMFIAFTDVSLEFALSKSALGAIIPSLSCVNSPLRVFGKPEDAIEKVTFDKHKGELRIHPGPFKEEQSLEGLPSLILGNWIYFPKKGFLPRLKHPLLEKQVYQGQEVSGVIDDYYTIIKPRLENVQIKDKPIEVSYHLFFDSDWNLHIEAYLFEPGDLSGGGSWFFGEWAYLEPAGLVHLDRVIFDQQETVIPEEKVGDFIQKNRSWLNEQEGFRINITGVETRLTYAMTEEDSVVFTRLAILEDGTAHSNDFGPWIYIKGQGFFSKVSGRVGIPIRSGLEIKRDQIPLFIRMYRDELTLVSGFFSETCPVEKAGLRITLTPEETVLITPEYKVRPRYRREEVKFFEDYTYIEGEGFARIPPQIQLPERFRYQVVLEKEQYPRFFDFELDQLKEFALWIEPRLIPPGSLVLNAETFSRHHDGYLAQLSYASETGSVKFSELWEASRKHQRFVFSSAGLVDLEDDRFNWMREVSDEKLDQRSNSLTLSTLEVLKLNAFDELHVAEGNIHWRELEELQTPDEPDLRKLKSRLRPYQESGLKWMWFLYHHGLSGLLCDDMGLGKTHQAMALMAAVAQKKEGRFHFLVVCPTSVIYHWEEKLQEFFPSARVCTYHGSKRSLDAFHEEYDILLTSYGIWRNENLLLSQVVFEVAVFDEIQAAKNQTSRIHTTLLKVRARTRIGLTGTPIENRLNELKALFDIILPGYMPPQAEYREFFVAPIEKENSASRKKLLSRYIKPFVTRRKKETVLTDLPDKTEEIAHCELSLDQKILYNDVLAKVREGICRELEDAGTPVPYIHIFSALSSLKQICNHPAAYLKNPEEYKQYESGKWDLFTELLWEALESGQKVVVFSQYLAMLDILERYLRDNKIDFAAIRGATLKRGEEIRKFNRDPSCQVFLGSLGAAGLGVDLTAGSVVIHYDRWWNAAREDQATDRVHRIGQTRGVQVFKLVTKGTFEERIDEMIARKGKLMEEVVGVDDYRFIKTFDRGEIMQLFRDVSE